MSVTTAARGDEVVLIGEQGREKIGAEEWADRLGTIAYEIVCGVSTRRRCSRGRSIGGGERCCSGSRSADPRRRRRRGALARPGDLIVLAGEMGAGKTAFAKGFGGDRRHRADHLADVHARAQLSPGLAGVTLHHADIYRLNPPRGRRSGVRSCSRCGIVLVEWGDVVAPVRRPRVWSRPVDEDETRDHRSPRPADRGRSLGRGRAATGGLPMLILGIETATEQVSVAIGGHEGVLGHVRGVSWSAPCRDARPGDPVRVQAGRHRACRSSAAIAVDVGPGLFTGMRVGLASAKAIAQALRVPMIGISSLDLLAFPLRQSGRRGGRGDRRPQG